MPLRPFRRRVRPGAPALLVMLLVALLSRAPRPAAAQDPPALVVLLTVDQLRPDHLERYRATFTGGFARLLRRGAYFPHGLQDHAITQTAPGHSTLLSGRFPAHTGVVTNDIGVVDTLAPLLGVPGRTGASPRRFIGTTLYDWMLARDSATRVLSVSRKDRSAILPVGRAAGEVYWYGYDGRFTTSHWYRESLPAWVKEWNARRGPARLAGTVWRPLLPDSAYPAPDDHPMENRGRDRVFPHRIPVAPDSLYPRLIGYPWMDSLTLDLALHGVSRLGLGRRGGTDLLAVSLSTSDEIGHAFGPASRELHDHLVRVDRWLAGFLDSLDAMVQGPMLLVLSSDHGSLPRPEDVPGADAGRQWLADLAAELDAELRRRWRAGFGVRFDYGLIMADTAALAARGVDVDSLAAAFARRVAARRGIGRVWTPATLAAAPAADSAAGRWRRSIPRDLGWLAAATLEPHWIWTRSPTGANHGTPADGDVRVPILFAGPGIRPAVHPAPMRTVDIAPTLALLLGIAPTEPLDGRPRPELLPAAQ